MSMLRTVAEWFAMIREKADYEERLRNRQTDWHGCLKYADWLDAHGMNQRADRYRIAAALKLEEPTAHHGDFFAQAYRRHANGDREPLWSACSVNLITVQGRAHSLLATFDGGPQEANWYFATIDGVVTPTLSTADTYQSHVGWTENTSYSEATRQLWEPTFTGNVATNVDLPATITASGESVLFGNGIVSDNTKGNSGAGPTLWCAGGYAGGPRSLSLASELDLFYALTLV